MKISEMVRKAESRDPLYLTELKDKNLLVHEHYGSCPHRNPTSGLCDIHHQGKPQWCMTFPACLDRQGNVIVQPSCVPHINWSAWGDHVRWLRGYAAGNPVAKRQLEDMGEEIVRLRLWERPAWAQRGAAVGKGARVLN